MPKISKEEEGLHEGKTEGRRLIGFGEISEATVYVQNYAQVDLHRVLEVFTRELESFLHRC